MNSRESLIFLGVFLALSSAVLLISIAGWRWALARNADYQKQRKFLLTLWTVASGYLFVKFGIEWLTAENAAVMDLIAGLIGTAWGFLLLFLGQRIAARLLGFQLPRR